MLIISVIVKCVSPVRTAIKEKSPEVLHFGTFFFSPHGDKRTKIHSDKAKGTACPLRHVPKGTKVRQTAQGTEPRRAVMRIHGWGTGTEQRSVRVNGRTAPHRHTPLHKAPSVS